MTDDYSASTRREQSSHPDHAEVAFHPPLLLFGSIGLGFAARWLAPAGFLPSGLALAVGPILTTVAFGLFFWAVLTMLRGGASIPTGQATDYVIFGGPYRFSRNPIYLGMVLLQIGVGIWSNSLWFIGLAVLSALLLNWGVISREERYLARKFGQQYLTYKGRVRRWC